VERDYSDELTSLMPIIHHVVVDPECPGRIVASVERGSVELRCNQCGSAVGVMQVGILEALLGLECIESVCPYCQHRNAFEEAAEAASYICEQCGRTVGP
jgi:rubrerythrin